MKRGVDTNVLMQAHLAGVPGHEPVAAWLRGQLRRSSVTLYVTVQVLHEFIHVVTDSRRFAPALTMAEALAATRLWLGAANVVCLPTEAEDMMLAIELIGRHRLGRNRIADTLFAATLLRHDVGEIATGNAADFQVFDDLRVIDPRAAG